MDTRSSQLLDRDNCDNGFFHIHMHTFDVFSSNEYICKRVFRER